MIFNNIYISDFCRELYFHKQNKLCRKLTSEVKRIDSITEFDAFKEYVSCEILDRVKKINRSVLSTHRYGEEGQWYGHRRCIIEYCDFKYKNDNFLLPNIVHGAELVGFELYREKIHRSAQSLVTMSDYKIEQVHKYNPWLQVYPIGPYIYYARGYYDEKKVYGIKKNNGKTALYFPQHSTETASVDFDKSVARKDMKELLDKYDTVLVCIYWADVDDELFGFYKKMGAKLVSAGVRSDDNFIRRLRTLFELSDDVYGNALGTNLGYAIAMNKPYFFFSNNVKIIDEAINDGYLDEIGRIESNVIKIWEEGNTKEKNNVYEKYWGGERFIRTKEEMRSIMNIQKKLLDISNGNICKIEEIVKEIVLKEKSKDFIDNEIKLIIESVNF